MISFSEIKEAKNRLASILNVNPLQNSRTFSEMFGGEVLLKPDCLQKCGSHKLRGAYYMLSKYSKEKRAAGVCTFSSGNWAQGVAYAGSLLRVPVTVIMPVDANPGKVSAARSYGAEVIQYGRESTELSVKARSLAEERGASMVSPLFDPDMAAGLGTVGLELFDERPDLTRVIVPLGSGGLISGTAAALKHLNPAIQVYGVQPEGSAAMVKALEAGRVVPLEKVETHADGLAIKEASPETFKVVKELVDGVVTVPEDAIEEAVFLLLERAKLVVEPSGAVPIAALISGAVNTRENDKTALVLTGGNIKLDYLHGILSKRVKLNASLQARGLS